MIQVTARQTCLCPPFLVYEPVNGRHSRCDFLRQEGVRAQILPVLPLYLEPTQSSERTIMTDYDPRTATGIPTEPVGSLPRPAKFQTAYAAHDEGKIDLAALQAEQEEAVKDSIERFEATGSPIISDGEQRVSSFATYPLTDTLSGTGLADNLGPGGQFFEIGRAHV